MIFITLGSQKFQFNRLLMAIDGLVDSGTIADKVYAQIGYSNYRPQNFEYREFMDRNEFERKMEKADIVITHGGTGAIVGALKKNKKVIAVPRLAKYQEHVDNHQLQVIKQFRELDLICECQDCEKLGDAIVTVKNKKYKTYKSNTKTIIESIEMFIDGMPL